MSAFRSWPKSKGALTGRGTRRELAQTAGLSLHQYRQAMRLANIPKDDFERLVESDDPPTIEVLARTGRQTRNGVKPTAARTHSRTCPIAGVREESPTW